MTTLVTGISGQVGGMVAADLAGRGVPIRGFARDPGRTPRLAGVDTVQGDYGDRASLDRAMAAVRTVFLVSAGGEPLRRARLHGNVIDAARQAGVERLVYLSFQGASATSPFPYSADHLLTEAHLKESGLDWTILRDSCYQDVLPHLVGRDGVVRSPDAGGSTAWVARADVARSAAAVLEDGSHGRSTYDLTGPEALSLRQAVERVADVIGEPIRYEAESYEAGRERLLAAGAQAWQAEVWLGSYLAIGTGELGTISDAVRRLTGREPLTFEGNAAALRPGGD